MLKDISTSDIQRIFTLAPAPNVARCGPDVLAALQGCNRLMACMALSTVAAETAPFAPLVEGPYRFNTLNFGEANQGHSSGSMTGG